MRERERERGGGERDCVRVEERESVTFWMPPSELSQLLQDLSAQLFSRITEP